MGNCVSGACSRPIPTVRILDLDGNNLRHVDIQIKVAEIMLEAPGKFVSPADEMLKTHRVSAMRADEELQAGKLYVLFPGGRMNSRISHEEMQVVSEACRRKRGAGGGGAKVFPARAVEEKEIEKTVPTLRILRADDEESDTGFPAHRLNNHRQWKPVLETITEAKLE